MNARQEKRLIAVRVNGDAWDRLKINARRQGLLLHDLVSRMVEVASGLMFDSEISHRDVPFKDWQSMIAIWYGRRRSYDDGGAALRIVIEAQAELGHTWPDSLMSYDAAWTMVHWLMNERGGLAPDVIETEHRENCERFWQVTVEKARAERKAILPLDEDAKSL